MFSCSSDAAPAPHTMHTQACGCAMPRRGFLKTLAGAAAASIGAGYSPAYAQTSPRRIDVHHHFLSPLFADNARERNIFPPQLKGLSLQASVDTMDRNGIETAMLSLAGPGIWFNDVPLAIKLARDSNEFAARGRADFKGRFGQFATLPLPDIDGALKEAAYALDVLKTDGVHMWTNYGDKWLGHPHFTPLLEELNRRKAVAYVHPIAANCCTNLIPEAPGPMIEFGTDTTRTIASLVLSGTTTRFPDIRWIFSHAGGVHMWTNYGDKWLGHPHFTPLLEELNRRKAVAYVHPIAANCCTNLIPEAPGPMIEFGTDTTRTIASLVLSGTTTRFPDIRWIFSHAGGTMPFLVERFLFQAEVQSRNPEGAKKIPNGVLSELKRFHYEMAQSANVYAVAALKQLVPTSQILMGTDYPYRRCDEQVQGLIDTKMFSEAELKAIGRDNAARLLSMPA